MLRQLAGVVGPSPADRRRMAQALPAARSLDLDDLALRHTGAAAERVGDLTCLVDGSFYAPPGADEAWLACAWEEEGEGALGRLRGDFVALVWDHRTGRGVIAADPFGARTLCWSGSALGSETRDVLDVLERRPRPEDRTIARWLAGGGPPAGLTFYAGIERLPPGSLLRIDNGRLSGPVEWWKPEFRGVRAVSEEELREQLKQAVDRRVDARSGVLLSGGIDSAAVAALAERPLPAYSAVFPDEPSVDESRLISAVTRHLGAASHTVSGYAGAALTGARRYLEEWQLPPSSPNLFFWLPLLERARDDGIQTMLDGEGGDELFGAPAFLIADNLRRGRLPAALQLARRLPGAGADPPLRPLLQALYRYGVAPSWPRLFGWRTLEAPGWFTTPTARAFAESHAHTRGTTGGPVWWTRLLDGLRGEDGPLVARDHVRRRSVLAGVEPRHPLYDLDLVELMLGADPRASFDPYRDRPLLRDAVRGLVPEEVRTRKGKSTFDAVFQRSLYGPERETVLALLTAPDAEVRAFADMGALERDVLRPAWDAPGRGRRTLFLWRLATLELWLRLQRGDGGTKP